MVSCWYPLANLMACPGGGVLDHVPPYIEFQIANNTALCSVVYKGFSPRLCFPIYFKQVCPRSD